MITNRIVEPYQLHYSETSWYLKGFCLHRQSYRTFKLSRIDNLNMNEETFNPRDYALEQETTRYQPQLVAIKALISPSIKINSLKGTVERVLKAIVLNISWLPSIFLRTLLISILAGFGTNLEIVEPKSYIEEFRNYLYKMVEKYSYLEN